MTRFTDASEPNSIALGPLVIQRLKREEAIAFVYDRVCNRTQTDIAICNAHTVLLALDDPKYASVLNSMVLFNDGMGVNLASRSLEGIWFPDNLNGTDFVPYLLDRIDAPLRVFLLGAEQSSVTGAAMRIAEDCPKHQIVGVQNGFFSASEVPRICEEISEAAPDLLLVAMGNPRQEVFIHDNRHSINATVTIGVGALFDFVSGKVERAPLWMRRWGLEWLFRLLQEPKRLSRRYLIGIPRFLTLILRLKRAR
ncbi:exopolysaccharide biosynthesis WecB/TagA/CpsF family protein [Roseibium hamelinense]|uniref:Exopolysaccharide biosynthesis WecB/TagA/CpsF family protein n=1 Tax=Roseibium hamelinense TaxID=150831 RepID=A0A562T1D5_9HYPH|nr:WecB/TagA/CpsF family glycosyltransferase [Roseibium hamelinense]TWI87073.1 exopolysaccharide biosynthesis WecB/TagA/CpsF family protein [Roseibium hamelinense]